MVAASLSVVTATTLHIDGRAPASKVQLELLRSDWLAGISRLGMDRQGKITEQRLRARTYMCCAGRSA